MALPPTSEGTVKPYADVEGEEAPQTPWLLKMLHTQLRTAQANGWKLDFIPRFYDDPNKSNLMEDTNAIAKRPTTTIEVPGKVNPGPKALFPEVYFSVYADQDIEVSLSSSSMLCTTTDYMPRLFRPQLISLRLSFVTFSSIPLTVSTSTAT